MPALVAPFVGFALGALLSLHTRGEAERYDEHAVRAARRVVALFAALVLAPITAYFVVFAGDWSLAYLADARAVPSAVALTWIIASAGAAWLGFAVGLGAVRRRARGELVALVSVPAAIAFIVVVALYPELRLDGTTAGVRGNFGTRPVAGSPLGWAILWMGGLLGAGFFLARRALVPLGHAAPSFDAEARRTDAQAPTAARAEPDAKDGAPRSDAPRPPPDAGPWPGSTPRRPQLLGRKRTRGAS